MPRLMLGLLASMRGCNCTNEEGLEFNKDSLFYKHRSELAVIKSMLVWLDFVLDILLKMK